MSAVDQGVAKGLKQGSSGRAEETPHKAVNGAPKSALGGLAKRIFDCVYSIAGLIFLAPLILMIAVAIKIISPGPVLYAHTRIGFGGKPFKCWKFRTMVVNGDEVLEAHLNANPADRYQWETTRKLRHDPRVTRLGRVLREYSIDELPQLINVFRGEMSFVGPRPVVADELLRYGPKAELYLATRPGITGLWQVSGRSDTGYDERVALDACYVERWSLATDIVILARTVPAVVGARGSY